MIDTEFNPEIIELDNKDWGFWDKLNQWHSFSKFDTSGIFINGFCIVIKNNLGGYINNEGELITECIFHNFESFSNGYACVRNNEVNGYIDQKGDFFVNFDQKYSICTFKDGFAEIYDFEEVPFKSSVLSRGILTTARKYIKNPKIHGTWVFSDGLAHWKISDSSYRQKYHKDYLICDKSGNEIRISEYHQIAPFKEGLAIVKEKDYEKESRFGYHETKIGYVNLLGELVIPVVYNKHDSTEYGSFSEGLAVVKNNNKKYGYINKTGEIIIPFEYDYATPFCQGFARVSKGGPYDWTYNYIDKNGKELLNFEFHYDDLRDFKNGFAHIRTGERGWTSERTVIKNNGEIFTEFRFAKIEEFIDGNACVLFDTNKRHGYNFLSENGELLFDSDFSEAESFSGGIAIVQKDCEHFFKSNVVGFEYRVYSIVNKKGEIILPFEYKHAINDNNGLAIVKRIGSKDYFYINGLGKSSKPIKKNEGLSKKIELFDKPIKPSSNNDGYYFKQLFNENYNDDIDMDEQSADFWDSVS